MVEKGTSCHGFAVIPCKQGTWICLRCLEQVKHILPNGGLMVIYHGAK